jgi:glycosyltransferase involved in cell wall biosynthesis
MRILFVSGLSGDTRRYRCTHHQQQLALHGIASTLCEASDYHLYVEAATCDLVILHRVAWSPLIADLVDLAHARGLPVVFETDDLIFAPELFDRIAFLETLSPDQAQRFRADLAGQAQTFIHCDCVLTSTEYLADAAQARGKRAYVQRNAASTEMVASAEQAYALRRQRLEQQVRRGQKQTPPLVIGYFSGTGSHNRDFAVVAPVLAELMGRYQHVWLHLSGHLEIGGSLLTFADRIRRAPFVAWQELPNIVAQTDINLAPLELDNPFCQAKSEIKYTEAALVGVPTVASPTQAYAYAIHDGQDGLLAATADEWRHALTRLIEEPGQADQLGESARRAVYAAYLPEKASQTLVTTLRKIRDRHAPAPAGADAVLRLLAERSVAQIEHRQAELEQVQRQAEQLRQTLARWEGGGSRAAAEFWRTGLQANQQRQQAILREILARLEQASAGDEQ